MRGNIGRITRVSLVLLNGGTVMAAMAGLLPHNAPYYVGIASITLAGAAMMAK